MSSIAERRHARTILPRTLSRTYTDFEYSVHIAPKSLGRELRSVFPVLTASKDPILVIPTFQRSAIELLEFGELQTREKDRLLDSFMTWATALRAALLAKSSTVWFDATDPASAQAHFGAPAGCYSDVDGIARVTNYHTTDAGACRIVKHPGWGYACYPAMAFTTAPKELFVEVLSCMNGYS